MDKYVLIADDDADDIYLMEKIIEETAFPVPVYCVRDGYQAIKHLEACADLLPSLVLLDINMPKLSGLEVMRYIKGSAQFSNIKVILFSTTSIRPAGVSDSEFIMKPNTYQGMKDFFDTLKEQLAA